MVGGKGRGGGRRRWQHCPMATPAVFSASLPAAPVAPRRAWRLGPLLALVLLVLGWHAWLVAWMSPGAPPAPRAGTAPVVQLRSLVLPALPAQAEERTVQVVNPPPSPPPAAGRPRPVEAALQAAPMPATAEAPPAETLPARQPITAQPGLQAADSLAEADSGEAPPLYATRLPAPVQLHYSLRINGQAGAARLVWQHDGQRYRLSLQAEAGSGAPLLAQTSVGALDGNGLAPERFVDRRRSGPQQAANFRQDIGRIGYSGPALQHPAWPGAQDRLSWLAQVAAILAAAEAPPAALRLFVTDARGHAGLWQLQRQPDQLGGTPWGEALLQHWQREPPRPEGLRIDLWLAADPAAPSGLWPLRLRWLVPRSGDVAELQLLAAP